MDPFAILGIPRTFDLDVKDAEKKHRDLSRALHPDRYAAAPPSERRAALQKAIEVNEAWRVVRDPVRRAEALFRLAGVAVGETNEPKPSGAFLMDVLEQREALAEAKGRGDGQAIASMARDIEARMRETERRLAGGLARGGDLTPLVPALGELRFYKRFLDEVSAIEEEMESGHGVARDL